MGIEGKPKFIEDPKKARVMAEIEAGHRRFASEYLPGDKETPKAIQRGEELAEFAGDRFDEIKSMDEKAIKEQVEYTSPQNSDSVVR